MRRKVRRSFLAGLCLLLAGCLASPVERSGSPGAVTIPDTNPRAITAAARQVFARYGYVPGPSGFPRWVSYERPAGRTGEIMFGGPFGDTAFRVRLDMVPIPGTRDIRVLPSVRRVSNAGRPGFQRETGMMRMWTTQFRSALRDIRDLAAHAGSR